MAVEERTLFGVIYLATPFVPSTDFPPHVVGVVQQERPWRRGKAVFLPWWASSWWQPRALVLGLWFPRLRGLFRRALDEDDEDALWFSGKPLDYPVSDIATWSNGADETPEALHSADETPTEWSGYRFIGAADREDGSLRAADHDGDAGSESGSADALLPDAPGDSDAVGDQARS